MDEFKQLEGKKNEPILLGEKGWVEREPQILGREHFELQYEFAKIVSSKNGMNIFDVIDFCAPLLRKEIFIFQNRQLVGLRENVTEEAILEYAYDSYIKNADRKPVPYHTKGETRFGCVHYHSIKDEGVVRFHFSNNEFDEISPLHAEKREQRVFEMQDLLTDLRHNSPEAKIIRGESWMLNIPSLQKLLPESFRKNLTPNYSVLPWMKGTTIWGQFIDSKGRVKEDLARELLERVQALKNVKPLSQLFENGSPIMPPLYSEAPIKDFYDMYGIK